MAYSGQVERFGEGLFPVDVWHIIDSELRGNPLYCTYCPQELGKWVYWSQWISSQLSRHKVVFQNPHSGSSQIHAVPKNKWTPFDPSIGYSEKPAISIVEPRNLDTNVITIPSLSTLSIIPDASIKSSTPNRLSFGGIVLQGNRIAFYKI